MEELDRRDPYYAALAHGEVAAYRENHPVAAAFYREAHRLDPQQKAPVQSLVKTSIAMGKFAEAFIACADLKPSFPGDGSMDAMFVEISARSGLRTDEALAASARYLTAAKNVVPLDRAEVQINTAIILKSIGRNEESAKLVAAAETQWAGSDKMFRSQEKSDRNQRPGLARQ